MEAEGNVISCTVVCKKCYRVVYWGKLVFCAGGEELAESLRETE